MAHQRFMVIDSIRIVSVVSIVVVPRLVKHQGAQLLASKYATSGSGVSHRLRFSGHLRYLHHRLVTNTTLWNDRRSRIRKGWVTTFLLVYQFFTVIGHD